MRGPLNRRPLKILMILVPSREECGHPGLCKDFKGLADGPLSD